MRRRAYLAAIGASTVALAGCGSSNATSGDHDIGMSSSRFKPESYAVTPGTTVRWKNTSSHAHTVTAYEDGIPEDADYFASGDFSSLEAARDGWTGGTNGALQTGDVFEHTFTIPGTYQYFCIPHEANGMVGTIEVTEDATRTPESGPVTTSPDSTTPE